MKRFTNKTVLVTGAGSGIGKATALRLDKEGANLIIADINQKHLIETKKLLSNKKSVAKVLDISKIKDARVVFQEIEDEFNKLDSLINVAGILRFDNSHEVQPKDWNKILAVNLKRQICIIWIMFLKTMTLKNY